VRKLIPRNPFRLPTEPDVGRRFCVASTAANLPSATYKEE